MKLLLLDIAESPMKKEEIESRLNSSKTNIDDLLRLEIIRQEGELFFINFPLFIAKDMPILREVSEKYSTLLAENILNKKKQIYDLLGSYQPSSVGKDKLSFIAVACLSLDLAGLSVLSENDYIASASEKPGGNRYTLNAQEITKFSLKEIYWGCHTELVNGILFMTFGDHHEETKRYGFPDILWRLRRSSTLKIPEFYKKEFQVLLNYQINNLIKNIGSILYILKESALPFEKIKQSSSFTETELKHILDFLIKINYITFKNDEYSLLIPAFNKADEKMLKEVQLIVNKAIINWADSYYEQIKVDLKDLSAVRNKVNYKELFVQLWHYFFGYTNKLLPRAGFIYDTYQGPEGQKGYLPAVMIRGH